SSPQIGSASTPSSASLRAPSSTVSYSLTHSPSPVTYSRAVLHICSSCVAPPEMAGDIPTAGDDMRAKRPLPRVPHTAAPWMVWMAHPPRDRADGIAPASQHG